MTEKNKKYLKRPKTDVKSHKKKQKLGKAIYN